MPRVVIAIACCVLSFAAPAMRPSAAADRPLTEVDGGTPAPALDPNPTLERFDPKSTFIFTDQAAFLEASWCITVPMESFEAVAATNQSNQSSITVSGFTVTTDHPPRLGIWDRRFQNASASDGSQWLGVNENQLVVPQQTTFTFTAPINHFGIHFADYGDFGGGDLIYSDNAGTIATAAFSGRPSGNRQFFGVITRHSEVTIVTLVHAVPGEFYGIDEVSYCLATAPPWPQVRRPAKRLVPAAP